MNFVKEFSGSEPQLWQIKGLPTAQCAPKETSSAEKQKGGVFNTATVGRGLAALKSDLRWV